MPRLERVREQVTQLPDAHEVELRAKDGWRLTALEWTREITTAARRGADKPVEEIPYGLMIGPDCRQLIEDPTEKAAILAMLQCIVQDQSMSQTAAELNRLGFKTRSGAAWSPGVVFDLLPRLIEVGRYTFSSDQWAEIRRGLFRRAG